MRAAVPPRGRALERVQHAELAGRIHLENCATLAEESGRAVHHAAGGGGSEEISGSVLRQARDRDSAIIYEAVQDAFIAVRIHLEQRSATDVDQVLANEDPAPPVTAPLGGAEKVAREVQDQSSQGTDPIEDARAKAVQHGLRSDRIQLEHDSTTETATLIRRPGDGLT